MKQVSVQTLYSILCSTEHDLTGIFWESSRENKFRGLFG